MPLASRFCCYCLACMCLLSGCTQASNTALLSGTIFGTSYQVVINDATLATHRDRQQALHTSISQRLQTVDELASNWNKQSHVMRINQAPVGTWVTVPRALIELLQQSRNITKLTGGFFDVTLGNSINHWGFGAIGVTADSTIVGHDFLVIDDARQRVKKNQAITLNLSAIAKGYAVDVISQYLLNRGFVNHLVEIGGEIQARGYKNAQRWRVGIESPDASLAKVIPLHQMAMATSGDYRNFIEQDDGTLLPHIIDPKTNKPIDHGLASVTVLHDSCTVADALATALLAMGFVAAQQFADTHQISAYFIQREKDDFVHVTTKRWQAVVVE